MDVSNDLYNSLVNYFNVLSNFGYKKYTDVYKLLVYSFIEEMLTGPFRIYITEDNYRSIATVLECFYGSSCLIPYPEYINDDSLFGKIFADEFIRNKNMEEGSIKSSESNLIRNHTSLFPPKTLDSEIITSIPTDEPTEEPTEAPTEEPTSEPTEVPTEAPTTPLESPN